MKLAKLEYTLVYSYTNTNVITTIFKKYSLIYPQPRADTPTSCNVEIGLIEDEHNDIAIVGCST